MPMIPHAVKCSKFFHSRSDLNNYVKNLEKLLPNSAAFLRYSFKSDNLESNFIVLVTKQDDKILEEKIEIKTTNDEIEFILSNKSKFRSLKELLEQKRSEWQKQYEQSLNIVCNFELARDQEVVNKIEENLIKIAENNLNNFLKNHPEKISNIFRLPKKLPVSSCLIKCFYPGHYWVSSDFGFFVISNTELQQLIDLTEKKEKKVTFTQKTPSVSPDYFARENKVVSDQPLYELSLEADRQSQEAETKKQEPVQSSLIFKRPEIKLYYEPDSQELSTSDELSGQFFTQKP